MTYEKRLALLFVLALTVLSGNFICSQVIPQSIKNTGIYDFLDELANNQVIDINSAIKPYSRMYIAKKLEEARKKSESLNPRQVSELKFYLRDFGKELNDFGEGSGGRESESKNGRTGEGLMLLKQKSAKRLDLFYYKDSLFSVTINPIIGGEALTNSTGTATYWKNGAQAIAYIGKFGFYGSLVDNHQNPYMGSSEYLTLQEGGHIKGLTDWSEMRGGVTFGWKWGYAGLFKEGLQWGNNYNGANIFGGRNPSFVQIRLNINPVKWFDFNYFHGWLNSMVVDSSESFIVNNSYGEDFREVYHKKFIAANMWTFTPLRHLNISLGNSIIYDYDNVHPAYLIPVMFFVSVDHSMSSGIDNMNSQMYFDISSRQIRNLHIYTSVFIDELSVSRLLKKDEWNFIGVKAGFRYSNLLNSNISLTAEYTHTNPLTYQHYVPTLTFENAGYNLGNYLKDNSREIYLAAEYKPVRSLAIELFYLNAIRGEDFSEIGGNWWDRTGNKPLSTVEWENSTIGIRSSFQVINDLYCSFSIINSNIQSDKMWSPEFYSGRRTTLSAGLIFGF